MTNHNRATLRAVLFFETGATLIVLAPAFLLSLVLTSPSMAQFSREGMQAQATEGASTQTSTAPRGGSLLGDLGLGPTQPGSGPGVSTAPGTPVKFSFRA